MITFDCKNLLIAPARGATLRCGYKAPPPSHFQSTLFPVCLIILQLLSPSSHQCGRGCRIRHAPVIRQACVMAGDTIAHKLMQTALFQTDPGARTGMIHKSVTVFHYFFLKSCGILSDIVEHSAAVSPVLFSKFCACIENTFLSSLMSAAAGYCVP